MPLSLKSVHLDGVKSRERERRASVCSAGSDGRCMLDNLDCELADLMGHLNLQGCPRAWPRGKVPYTIRRSFHVSKLYPSFYDAIEMGIETFNRQVASLKWVRRENEEDYVEFVYSHCSRSFMGRQGGRQELELAGWATSGTVLHEMGHAIGLAHEHCRFDRDRFVRVHMDRIEEGEAHNFEIISDGAHLGKYDYDSIMHYPSCAFSKDGRATIEAPPAVAERMGQRREFSRGDLRGIEQIYGFMQCTYEKCGEEYWPQYWFECRTCWGGTSNYGCCFICALTCHSGPDHRLVRGKVSPDIVFACDCGRNNHQRAVCTWHTTKKKAVKQPLFHCRDCFKTAGDRCCYQCMMTCHAIHCVALVGTMEGHCRCGMEGCGVTCRIPNPTCKNGCTYDKEGEEYHQQPWYECRTCWGEVSEYGCCLSCAFNCHKGHYLVYHPAEDDGFICDCGRNKHQKVCTWHSTKMEYRMQPFYRCYDCFKGSHEGCCYQCVKICHVGHNTRFAGIMEAFCDCGLKCCRISCIIPEPLDGNYYIQLRHDQNYHIHISARGLICENVKLYRYYEGKC